MKVWVNGMLTDAADARISVFDHGLTVGDGVFETVKVVDGQPFALTRHLRRLAHSARGLGLPEPDLERVRRACADVLAANERTPLGRLRITYTGGVSPLGSERGDSGPSMIVALAPLQPHPATTAIVTVPWPRNERGATAGLKTTSYAENVIALARARAQGASEAIFPNTLGNVCEGTGSNIFLVLDGRLVTPPLSAGCLAGVTRDLVIAWCGAEERDVPMSALKEAEEIFLASTTRDVQAVHRVDDRELPGAPGPVTAKAMKVFAQHAAEDPDP
ncbi:class IV aminotransferase [Carbonactinospora thermoautotrophica]|uniref:aminodeoxychorismate lyase n=2 Tax=Carbonactinospora thermoautotrophica TaxID=1469144 RepID=A0A132NJE4_9ACTN|nr:aminotransferase class IV [Carbonactinospora thermoautotrophica]KWX04318.1 class IV aminotransferase [Carbonactinospora thermoautotrophica]KWX10208.1 class IV aminotransferase [Carbonactinospora thermoautotrophica]